MMSLLILITLMMIMRKSLITVMNLITWPFHSIYMKTFYVFKAYVRLLTTAQINQSRYNFNATGDTEKASYTVTGS